MSEGLPHGSLGVLVVNDGTSLPDAPDERPVRVRLRGFLEEASAIPGAHGLIIGSSRVSRAAVAEDLWHLAKRRSYQFVAVGRRLLADAQGTALPPPGTCVEVPEPASRDIADFATRMAEVQARGKLRGCKGSVLLFAPAEGDVDRIRSLDAALASTPDPWAFRCCLLTRAWLRRQGTAGAWGAVRDHPLQLVLP